MISTEDSIIRLIMALILGGLIGYERQAKSKSAGLRTHTLVCVGSCLCMIISINIAMDYYFTFGYNNSDPERIAAQAVSAIGLVVGAGYLVIACVATALIFLVLTVFVRLDARLEGHFRKRYAMHLVMKNNIGQARKLSTFIHDHHMHIKTFHSHNDDDAPLADIDLELTAAHYMDETEIVSQLLAMKGIKQATFHVDAGARHDSEDHK